jgi:hypothetical protein
MVGKRSFNSGKPCLKLTENLVCQVSPVNFPTVMGDRFGDKSIAVLVAIALISVDTAHRSRPSAATDY